MKNHWYPQKPSKAGAGWTQGPALPCAPAAVPACDAHIEKRQVWTRHCQCNWGGRDCIHLDTTSAQAELPTDQNWS